MRLRESGRLEWYDAAEVLEGVEAARMAAREEGGELEARLAELDEPGQCPLESGLEGRQLAGWRAGGGVVAAERDAWSCAWVLFSKNFKEREAKGTHPPQSQQT